MTPEDKSDELDAKILAVSARGYKQEKLRTSLLVATLVFMVAGFIAQFIVLQDISRAHDHLIQSTHETVTSQIPSLNKQIEDRDKAISDYQFILQQQAIPAIQKLSAQVKALGGDPGEVVLKPPGT